MHFSGRRLSLAACLACSLLASAPGRSVAQGVIASNLDANGGFGPNFFNLTGSGAATGVGYGLAVKFTVPVTSPVAFDSAELALWYHGGNDAVDVLLLADNAGRPGATLETIHLGGISSNASGVVATSAARPILKPTTSYWLAAVASNDTYLSWMLNDLGQSGHFAYRTDTGRGPGPWRVAPGNGDPAFAIHASPVVAASSFARSAIVARKPAGSPLR